MNAPAGPLVYIIAGEPSGDLLGGRLMAALRQRTEGRVRFAGIGGPAMRDQGLASLVPMADLAVMGLVEVLPRIPRILGHVKATLADIEARRPDAVVTIDSWGFTGRVQSGLKKRFPAIPRIHYVAPMVWAWKAKRAKTLAGVLDMLMTLLPFEPEWFLREGLQTICVGHPVIEGEGRGDGAAFRARHGVPLDRSLLCVLPGSRMSETSRLLPVFSEAIARIAATHPDLTLVVPTVETVAEAVGKAAAGWPLPAIVVEGDEEKRDAFAACRAALAASGTVTLELARAGLPCVAAYRVSPLTAFIARRFLGFRLKFASIVNIVMDAMVIPERLQEACTGPALAEAVSTLLDDEKARATQIAGMDEAMRRLGQDGLPPSQRAAEAVLALIAERKAP